MHDPSSHNEEEPHLQHSGQIEWHNGGMVFIKLHATLKVPGYYAHRLIIHGYWLDVLQINWSGYNSASTYIEFYPAKLDATTPLTITGQELALRVFGEVLLQKLLAGKPGDRTHLDIQDGVQIVQKITALIPQSGK